MKDLLVKFDPYARKVGYYTAYTLSKDEFIGTTPYTTPGIHWYLPDSGYAQLSLLEAAKFHPETGAVHDFSYRKVDPESPRWQWHIHGWLNKGESPKETYYELFSHYEYRPDFRLIGDESVSEAIERLRTHYRPNHGEEYLRGVACDDVKELVD